MSPGRIRCTDMKKAGYGATQNFPAVSDSWSQPSKMLVAKLTTTIGSNKVNDFAFSWGANRINITQAGDNPQLQQQIVSAMPLIFPTSGKTHATQLPATDLLVRYVSRLPSVRGATVRTCTRGKMISPSPRANTPSSWACSTTKTPRTRNRAKRPAECGARRVTLCRGTTQAVFQGRALLWSSPTGGNQWSDTILKNVLWGVNENSINPISDPRWRDTEFYFGDTWKITRTFTLDYGFRWSFMPDAWLDDNKLAAFEPSAYNASLGNSPCNGVVLAAGAPNGCAALGVRWRCLFQESQHCSLKLPPDCAALWFRMGRIRPREVCAARGDWAVLHSRSDQRHEHPARRRKSPVHGRRRP